MDQGQAQSLVDLAAKQALMLDALGQTLARTCVAVEVVGLLLLVTLFFVVAFGGRK